MTERKLKLIEVLYIKGCEKYGDEMIEKDRFIKRFSDMTQKDIKFLIDNFVSL